MKKVLSIILIMMLLVTLFTGCAKKSSEEAATVTKEAEVEKQATDTKATDTKTANTEKSEVTIWYYWENEGHQKTLNEIVQSFNASQESVTVNAEYVPFADFKKQLSIGAAASQLPDMVILDSPDHASYATMGIFADITDKVDVSKYFAGTVASASLDGKLYGVPFGVNCLALYYNTDMLKAANVSVPTTWDELKDASAKLTKENVTGIAFSSPQNEEGTFNFMPWVWSTGATSFEIGSDKGIRALAFAKDLVQSGSMSKEVINWTQGDVMNQFMSGNIAMMINGPWQVPSMRADGKGINWDVALIPKDATNASVLGGENYGIISGGNEAGALAFLEFATQEDNVKKMMNQFGYISAISDIAASQFSDDAIMSKFTEQLQYALPRGPHAQWPEISDAISTAFNKVMMGAATPEEAGAEAQATIDSIVK